MLLSVIIPAYNAEKYIEKTLEKVFDFECDFEYEVIVVDDGSKDKTPDILSKLQQKYSALKFVSIENSGPSGARNFGLSEAKGEYIMFCDSDDGFTDKAISKIMKKVLVNSPDLFIFGYEITDGEKLSHKYYSDKAFYTKEEFGKNMHTLYAKNMLNQVWGKVFKRDIISENKVEFFNTRWGEDRLYLFDYIKNAQSVEVTDECYYLYYQNKGSLISAYVPDKFDVCLEIDKRVRELHAYPNESKAKEIFDYMFMKSVFSSITMFYSPKCSLTNVEKRRFVGDILNNERVKSPKVYPENCGKAFKILSGVVKTGNVTLVMSVMRGVYFASGNMTSLFRKLKHKMN